MPVSIAKIKNFIIGFLALLAVYQTSQLWFNDTMGHNFFYSIKNRGVDTVDDEYYASFTYPYRLITGFGSNRFQISYGDMADSAARALGDDIITHAMKNGDFVEQADINWLKLLSGRALIYEYDFDMPSDLFANNFPQKSGLLSSRLASFDTIVMEADFSNSNLIRLYFVSKAQNSYVELDYRSVSLCDELKKHIQEVQKNFGENDIYYISTKLLHMDTPGNLFIPRWRDEGYPYFAGEISVDYYEYDVDKARVRSNLMSFFDNPSAVWDSGIDIISSSDENAMVRYFDNDVLEYSNYRADTSESGSRLIDDYVSALKFIDTKDSLMDNGIYFAGYEEEKATGHRYLYFDFIAGDFPVIFSDSLMENMGGLKHGITFTFKNGNLLNYTKLAYSFNVNQALYERATENYIDFIDAQGFEAEEIEGISFGYSAGVRNRVDGDITMKLAIEFIIDGKRTSYIAL